MNSHSSSITHINLANGFRGGERQTFLLIKELSSRGFEQILIAKKNSLLATKSNPIDNLKIIESRWNALDCFKFLRKDTILHFHEPRAFVFAWLFGITKGYKYLVTRRVQRPPRSNFINKAIYLKANSIVALSNAIGHSIEKALGSEINYEVIPSAKTGFIPNESEVNRIKSNHEGSFIVGHIGTLDDSHKGQQQIIELAKSMQVSESDISFILIGSGRDFKQLKQQSEGLDNLKFIGQMDNIGDYLSLFDVFIFPSRHEGLGSILLDAMDFSLPIVGSNIGGIPELIEDGINGFLVDINNIEGYKDALNKIYRDKELRVKIQKNNLEKSKKFTSGIMADEYIKLYDRINNGL
tara:strand:+ start:77 stop:1135 length:1059 start_codon:yes stop_codon:yes gene_type:complete